MATRPLVIAFDVIDGLSALPESSLWAEERSAVS